MITPVPVQPDLEAWLWDQIKHIDGVTSFVYSIIPMPMVPWQVAYSVQIDARHKTKQAAADRAEQVRRVIWALPDAPWRDGVISYVQITDGGWLPDEDGAPRYFWRAELRVHPNRPAVSVRTMRTADDGRPVGRQET